ncbi:MAG: acyl-CoA/acyl-ACP dehydrogenase [Pseudobacteriovorax sp.]|nr:acyl-CoA/acyl-ACP dehydrogenase [Pseudobacteriovorax sp.]
MPKNKSVEKSNSHNQKQDEGISQTTATNHGITKILQQSGKSREEIASLTALDDADRSADQLFSGAAPTVESLFGTPKAREFYAGQFAPSKTVGAVMNRSIEFLLEQKKSDGLLDHKRMLFTESVISGLSQIGFFGLAIPEEYGGSGAKLGDLGPLLRTLTFIHPDLAVMFEVHNFLGPVTPLLDYGTEEQKQKYLPRMAKGELLGSFALTEPGVGADPSRLSMTARKEDDSYVLNGVKWPITNVVYGGLCVLVVKLENEGLPPGRDFGMIIFETPKENGDEFKMTRNDLKAFDYLWNARFRLTNLKVSSKQLLGPSGRGLAIAFSSLAKGRGGIGVNSAAKCFKLLAQLINDPEVREQSIEKQAEPKGWLGFRSTFGKPIGDAPRIQSWVGKAICHGLAARDVGDLCFRLAANDVRDETQGMIAKVYATKALVETAVHSYQILGGRSVHTDEEKKLERQSNLEGNTYDSKRLIENYIGENIHEFLIATVYEGPNPVLADVGAPNAMTRDIRAKYLEPIGLAEATGKSSLFPILKFGWFVGKAIISSFFPRSDLSGLKNLFPEKKRYIEKALKRNRILGRQLLLIIGKHQKKFMDQSFVLGDEGGIFDKLCANLALLCFALSMDKPKVEYLQVAKALDLESKEKMRGKVATPELHKIWSNIGITAMNPQSQLYRDLLADIEIKKIPLDPRYIDHYI